MALNLVELINRQLSGPVLDRLAALLGESSASVQTAVTHAVPAIVGSMLAKVSNPDGASELLSSLQKFSGERDLLNNFSGLLQEGNYEYLLESGRAGMQFLFGDKTDDIANSLAGLSNMGERSVRTLLGLITPVAMSILGKQQNDLVLDADGLKRLLAEQKATVAAALPAELTEPAGLGELAGRTSAVPADNPAASTLGSAAQDLSAATRSTAEERTAAAAARSGGSGMGKIIMILVILAVLVWLAYRFLLTPA
jgi:hypothetical protein